MSATHKLLLVNDGRDAVKLIDYLHFGMVR
jgi:hypothetical protein